MSLFSMDNLQKVVDGAKNSGVFDALLKDPFGNPDRNQPEEETPRRSGKSEIWTPEPNWIYGRPREENESVEQVGPSKVEMETSNDETPSSETPRRTWNDLLFSPRKEVN